MVSGRACHRPPACAPGEGAGRGIARAAAPAARAGAVLARLYVRAGRADDAQGLPCAIRSDRVAGQDAIPDTSAHAAAWLRLCPSQRRPPHRGAAGLARAQNHSAHGQVYRACARSVQGFLAMTEERVRAGPETGFLAHKTPRAAPIAPALEKQIREALATPGRPVCARSPLGLASILAQCSGSTALSSRHAS